MNDDRSTKPTSKIRVLVGITGACVAVIAIVVLVYALTMPPSPEEVAESYKEILDDLGLKIPNLQAEAVPQTQQPESTATGTPQPTEPTEPAPPTALPKEIAEAGICGRTPEVQERLIEALKIASCRRIDAAELYRIRKFSVTAQSFKAGDFDHLSNVQVMELHAAKPVELSAGIFEDLQSLITLEIDSYNIPTIRLNKDTFRGLNNLIVLDIEYVEHLPEEALDHMQQLKQLNISYLKGDIPGKALDQLHNVQSISISAYTEENSNPRTIPADFLKNLPKLEKVSISKEYLPDSMEVNSYETACQIGNWSLQDKEGNRISMTVDSKIVEVTDRTTDHDPINDRDVRICQFNVGDTETKKIIIALE